MTKTDLTQAKADAIPRYAQPMDVPDDFDECQHCDDCFHCMRITDSEARMFVRAMHDLNLYGKWHTVEREVDRAVTHTLRCHGVCEVKGELVMLTDPWCDHFQEQE
jgi:hypothetical protein